jgi:hypothetical protein
LAGTNPNDLEVSLIITLADNGTNFDSTDIQSNENVFCGQLIIPP